MIERELTKKMPLRAGDASQQEEQTIILFMEFDTVLSEETASHLRERIDWDATFHRAAGYDPVAVYDLLKNTVVP